MNKLLSSIALVFSLWITLSLCVIMTDHKVPVGAVIEDCCTSENITLPETPAESSTPIESKSAPDKAVPGKNTFAMIKPNAVQDRVTGEIIRLIELNGFAIARMEKKQLTKKEAEDFYQEHKNRPFFKDLVHFMTSGPVIILKLEKPDAIIQWRTLMGATNPERADVGTLRKMFGEDITHNAVHGSDSDANAARELAFFNLL